MWVSRPFPPPSCPTKHLSSVPIFPRVLLFIWWPLTNWIGSLTHTTGLIGMYFLPVGYVKGHNLGLMRRAFSITSLVLTGLYHLLASSIQHHLQNEFIIPICPQRVRFKSILGAERWYIKNNNKFIIIYLKTSWVKDIRTVVFLVFALSEASKKF